MVDIKYIEQNLSKGVFKTIFTEDGTENSAKKLATILDEAIGIGKFIDEETNQTKYGVLIDKTLIKKKD